MPIKGLTDRGLAFPEIGQIRKGAPKTDKGYVGKDLTYFRVEFDEREVKVANAFKDVYGDEPKQIRIILPFNEIDRMWDAWLEAYTAGRMVARADGERFMYLVDVESGEVLVKNGEPYKAHKDVVGQYKDGKGKMQDIVCKPTGRLKVIIPELARAAYMTVLTTSVHDIANISEQLEAFKELNKGQIAGIPLVLRRRPKKISTPGANGQRVRREKWLLSIEADPDWVKAKLTDLKRLALPENGLEMLPSGEFDDDDEDEHIPEGEITEVVEDTEETEPEPEKKAEEPSPNGGEDLRPKTATDWQSFYNYSNTIISYEEGAAIAKETKDAQVAYDKVKAMEGRSAKK